MFTHCECIIDLKTIRSIKKIIRTYIFNTFISKNNKNSMNSPNQITIDGRTEQR